MPPRFNGMKLNEKYCLPENTLTFIKEHQNLQDVLQTIDKLKRDGQEENETTSTSLKTLVIIRNILICAAWYDSSAVINYIITECIISGWWTQYRKAPSSKADENDFLNDFLKLPMFIATYKKRNNIVNMFVEYIKDVTKVISVSELECLEYWKEEEGLIYFGQHSIYHEFSQITTFNMIIYDDNLELLKAFEKDPNINWKTCFYNACMYKAETCAEYMLQNVAELKNDVASLTYKCKQQNVFTPLMVAAQSSYKITKMLLESGVNVNACDGSDRNSLHFAVAPSYLHEEVRWRNYAGDGGIDESSTILIEHDKYFDIHGENSQFHIISSRRQKLRCLEINEETVKIVKILLEYGIDKTLVGCTLNDCVKLNCFESNMTSNLDPGQVGNIEFLTPIQILLYQIAVMSFHVGCLTVNYDHEKLPSPVNLRQHRDVIDQLLTCMFNESDWQKTFTAWYYATLYGILNSTISLQPSFCDCEDFVFNNISFEHDIMEVTFQHSLASVLKLLELSDSSFSVFCQLNDFGVVWLFMRMVQALCPRVCQIHENVTRECVAFSITKEIAESRIPVYKKLLHQMLKIYFAYGFTMTDDLFEFEIIARITHREESVYFVPELLSLLCTLSHKQFYRAASMLENPPESVCNLDERYWLSSEVDMDAANPEDFIKPCCMYSKIKALGLANSPRLLAHIARLAIYESTGRLFKPGVIFSQSKIIQEYITGFEY